MMNKENPAAAGAVFDSDYTLVPSDDIRITNNIEKAKQITSKLSSLDGDIKNKDSKLFSSLSNKLAKSPSPSKSPYFPFYIF